MATSILRVARVLRSSTAGTAMAATEPRGLPALIDRAYRAAIFNNFFYKGFGDPAAVQRIMDLKKTAKETLGELVPRFAQQVTLSRTLQRKTYSVWQGSMPSPLEQISPGLLPPRTDRVQFQLVLPPAADQHLTASLEAASAAAQQASPQQARHPQHEHQHLHAQQQQPQQQQPAFNGSQLLPMFMHLAATGDHGFWRRRHLHAIPLAEKYGIGSLLFEHALYGSRRAPEQMRSNLRFVSDLYLMGLAIMYETVPLLHWLEQRGLGPFGVGGFSMGGYMSSVVLSAWPKPMGLVSFVGPSTASGVFCRGLLSASCNWRALASELAVQLPNAKSQVVDYLAQQLDQITSINTYDKPVSTSAAIVYAAKHDRYVPLEDMLAFKKHWPDVDLRVIDEGHVTAFVRNNSKYIHAVAESMQRLGYRLPSSASAPASSSFADRLPNFPRGLAV